MSRPLRPSMRTLADLQWLNYGPFFSRSCKPILGDDPADYDDWCSWRNRRFRVTEAEARAAGVFPEAESSAQQAAQPKPLPLVDGPPAGQLQQLALVDVPRAKPTVDTPQAAQPAKLPVVDVPKAKPTVDAHQAAQQQLALVHGPTAKPTVDAHQAAQQQLADGPTAKPTVDAHQAAQQQLALVDGPTAKPTVDTHQAAQQKHVPLVDVPKTKPAVDTPQAAQQESLPLVDVPKTKPAVEVVVADGPKVEPTPEVIVDTQFDKARELSYVRGPIIYLKPHHKLQGVPGHLVPPIAVVDRSWFPEGLQQSVAQDPAGLTPYDAVG